MRCEVYGLRLKGSGEFRYIGQTKLPVWVRLAQHEKAARKNGQLPVHRWLRKHEGFVEVVTITSRGSWNSSEQYQIMKYRRAGHRLLNCTDGGDGLSGTRHTEETKIQMSKAHASVVSEDLVRQVRKRKAEGARVGVIGQETGLSHSMVSLIANRRIWRWVKDDLQLDTRQSMTGARR